MPRTILGKVSLTPKGEYSPDTAYTALDVVSYGGSSWMALKDVTGVAPAEGENWMLLAQKGDKGEQGIQGIQGIQGETGGPGPTGPQGASFTRLEKTAGTGAPGTIDTYTAYNSEGQAAGTVQVYNGMDGTGAGDFKADGTVPMTGDLQMAQHKVTGLADATEDGDAVNKGQMDAALEGVTVTTDAAPTEDSTNPVQSGGVFDALAGRADLTLSNLSNRQKALHNIGGRPNRNLLDNWYFVGGGSQQGGGQFPINQRGQTSYGPGHVFDRWKLNGGSLELANDGISFSAEYVLWSTFEHINFADGQQRTVSYMDENGDVFSGPFTPSYTAIGNYIFYYNGDAAGNDFYCRARVGSPKIKAMKLEFGPIQTLAYQDEEGNWQLFETPDYAEELARCQRYLLVLPGFNTLFSNIGVGSFFSETEAEITIPTPTTMRIMPTCVATGNWLLRGGGQAINAEAGASNFFVQQMSSNAVSMIINGLSGCPANQATQLLRSNSSTAKITLSAEL